MTLHGLTLRKAILEALRAARKDKPEESVVKQEDLARQLHVAQDRLEAHFTFLERAGYVTSLHMPGPTGERLRFLTITPTGEKYLKEAKNFEPPKGLESPFKVVEGGAEQPIMGTAALRKYVEETEWVLDEEKPDIVAKIDELERALDSDRFDPGAVSALKLYFERHRWLAKHVDATIKAKYGF